MDKNETLSLCALIDHSYIPGVSRKMRENPGLSKKKMKIQDFPQFPGGVRTLRILINFNNEI